MQDHITVLQRHAAASVQSLHHIRARTSRVLAATSAFTAFEVEARSLREVVRTLVSLARASDESVDRGYVERELSRLREGFCELQRRFSRELVSAAESERPPPPPPLMKRWWQLWR